MVDEEVENILREIRERVRAQELPAAAIANSAMGNGSESSTDPHEAIDTSAAEAEARIDSYLTTTSRAWDRLPPLMSYREGGIASFELWVKQQIKRATHWFTWEQVNFNAAVHHALRDMLEAQRAAYADYEQKLKTLRAELNVQVEAQRAGQSGFEQALGDLRTELKFQAEAQRAAHLDYEQELKKLRAELKFQIEAKHAAQADYEQSLKKLRAEMSVQLETQVGAQRKEIDARLLDLSEELRERSDRLQEEQRVCFKQLSLEATESAVLEDRARHKTETLFEELKRRIKKLEKQ
jgi:hypothetical protein